MSVLRHLLIGLLLFGLGGCKSTPAPTTAPQESWMTQKLSVPAQATIKPVKEGPAPLTYLVDYPCMVRVMDVTSGENLLTIPVTEKTLVTVNPRVGVIIGTATMKAGPLPADHRYAIYLESNTRQNYIEHGTVRPGQPQQQP